MAETVKKVIFEIDGKDYEFEGSGTPEKDSVGTDEIKDKSVMLEDLNEEVTDELVHATESDVDELFEQ